MTGDSSPARSEAPAFPIVALGASAGGLEALQQILANVPAESGLAFVVIQHLDPDRPSMLAHVIERSTRLSVVEAANGMRLERGRVHVIPSGVDLMIQRGILSTVPRERTSRLHLPIDTFFRSLAEDSQGHAIGVVLSGSGADGREGLRAIKAEGGIAIAQEPESAQFRSMPESAIAAGVVDFRGSPTEIAGELARLSLHPYLFSSRPIEPGEDSSLATAFAILRRHAGVDFSGYKPTTVLRRIERRMALRRVRSLEEYARTLRDDPGEAQMLARDMLIHVTSFFRDPDAFVALKEQAFGDLAQRKADGDSIRIWVPGCSTGEEAYAVTICLLEALDGLRRDFSIKVFGSDLSDEAIARARLGFYAESAVGDISPQRMSRFFERLDGGYRIGKLVRDLCVFVKHDLTRDPPFAKLDLISCRNVLIYFGTDLQRKVIPLLHYCLNPQGYLFLGQSEMITGFREFFAPVDKEHRIFVKTGDSPRFVYPLPVGREVESRLSQQKTERVHPVREAQRQVDHLLLARYAPPGVIVNEQMEIIQYRGRTGAYLEPPPGQPQANVLRMAREGLVVHLHEAIEHAKTRSASVRKEGVSLQVGSQVRNVDLEVIPLAKMPGATEGYYLILFEDGSAPGARLGGPSARSMMPASPTDAAAEAEKLRADLDATRDFLQSLIAEHQTATDELASMNEEMISSNEELQSTNEELQSAKEELQSTNEELTTVNEQLESRNRELDLVANDLVNVLASVEIPVIIVDLDLHVRRCTPAVRDIASFIPEKDMGRPIDDLKLKIQVEDFPGRIREVTRDLVAKEWEVQGQGGRWFRMAIRPYRTVDDRLGGAVLSFVDVDALKHAIYDAEAARDYARSIVETVPAALLVLDGSASVVSANGAFYERFGFSAKAADGKSIFDLGPGPWEIPVVREALDELLTAGKPFTTLERPVELPRLGRRVFDLRGRPLLRRGGAPMFLLAIEDVTVLRALEAERAELLESEKQARLDAERANLAKDLFLATLSHELRTPLSTMLMSAQILRHVATDDPRIQRASASIERSANTQVRMIDDLLDISRIVSGKLLLDLGSVDLAAIVQEIVDASRSSAQAKALNLDSDIDATIGFVYGDAGRLQQVVSNLLSNAIKFTPHGGRVFLHLERIDGRAQLTVADTGIGIRPESLPHLFTRFVQADSSITRTHGGLGLGLSIVRHLVEVHGGEVHAESPGEGRGASFIVKLPLGSAQPAPSAAPRTAETCIEGVRILLVEDDDDTREAYSTMLAALGAVVRAEPSAAAGLIALAEFRPQVILSDIAMPGEDGFSFIRRVRSLGPDCCGRVPAAALTALASDADRQRAVQSGFQMHLAKPIDSARLAAAVSRLAAWHPL